MKRNKKTLIYLLSLITVGVLASELETCTDNYQKDVQRIENDFQTKVELAKTNYISSLETLLSKIQATGNLDKSLAVKTEVERFNTVGTISKSASNTLIPEIATPQDKLRKDWVLLKQNRIMALGQRSVKQDESLGLLIKSLTKEGKLDEALAVKTELDNLKKTIQDYKNELLLLKNNDTPLTNPIDKVLPETNTTVRLRPLTPTTNKNDDSKYAIGLYQSGKFLIRIREDGTATHNGLKTPGTWKIENGKVFVSYEDGSLYTIPLIKDKTAGSWVEMAVVNKDGKAMKGVYKKVE